jgi:putative endonuclease
MTLVTNKIGVVGEKIASNFLLKNGYKLLNKNYRTKYGEIDLIALKNNVIHFIEVKTKTSNLPIYPYEAVNDKKITKIKHVINIYLKNMNYEDKKLSIDVFSIILDKDNEIKDLKIFENITN